MPTVPRRFTCPVTAGTESAAGEGTTGEGTSPSWPAAGVAVSSAPAPSRRKEESRRRTRKPRDEERDEEDLCRYIRRKATVSSASLPTSHRRANTSSREEAREGRLRIRGASTNRLVCATG